MPTPLTPEQILALNNLGGGWPPSPQFGTLLQELINGDSDLRDVYVDTANGDDNAAGTASEPVATIQEAANRLEANQSEWAIDDTRTIYVTGNVEESVLLKGHPGLGALRIISQDVQVLQTLEQSGAPATIARTGGDFFVRNRISYTAPIDASVIGDSGAYAVPNPLPASSIFEECYEYAPIVDVSGSDLDVDLVQPGVLSGFGHVNGAVIEVRSPTATWRPALATPTGVRFYGVYCIANPSGSPLILEGFRAVTASGGFSDLDTFLVNGPSFNAGAGTTAVIQGCAFDVSGGIGITPFAGTGVTLNGVVNGNVSPRNASSCFLLNARFTGALSLAGGIDNQIYGADTASSLAFLDGEFPVVRADTEGTVQVVNALVRVQALSVESGVSSCISIGQGGLLNTTQAQNGNRLYGLSTSAVIEAVFLNGPNASLVAPSSTIANFNFNSSAANQLRIVGTTNTTQDFSAGSAGTDYANVFASD